MLLKWIPTVLFCLPVMLLSWCSNVSCSNFFRRISKAGWIKPRKWFTLFHHCCVFTSGWQPSTSFVLGSRQSIMNRSQYWTHRCCSACSQYKRVGCCAVCVVFSLTASAPTFYFIFHSTPNMTGPQSHLSPLILTETNLHISTNTGQLSSFSPQSINVLHYSMADPPAVHGL